MSRRPSLGLPSIRCAGKQPPAGCAHAARLPYPRAELPRLGGELRNSTGGSLTGGNRPQPRRWAPAEGAAAAPGPAERGAEGSPGAAATPGTGASPDARDFSPSLFPCIQRDAASPAEVASSGARPSNFEHPTGHGGAGRRVLRCLPEQFQPVGVWQSLKEVGKAASLSGRARTSSTAGSSSQQQQSQSVQPPPHCRGGEGSQGTMTS